ncbi:GNAT family N-acetyltransferase [Amycolatopsis sp.]|jgi:RimJ/RimL family protein N-acetyltransferase/catechol 2,3-dioxygenase-like lactoylglutathione lyase family enzyme|uniref:GNAT family N-acetyltransferase n=1 Tax=Amycolatopsis sp. TaxID=37632 RepID=UPI002DFD53DC|nr:GNAT family N-acetyltransferase [Amycolatopsis sp.]
MSVPVLRTERLVLREIAPTDTDAVIRMFADPWMSRFFAADLADPVQAKALVDRKLADDSAEGLGQWVIELDGKLVGLAHLRPSTQLPGGLAEIGYSLDRAHGGQGLATEAVTAVLDHGLSTMALPAIWALIHESNVASLNLAQRLGFLDVGNGVHYGAEHRVQVVLPGAHGKPHHIELWVPDLARAEESFGWLLGALGWHEFQRWSAGVSWKLGTGYLVVEQSPAVLGEPHDRMRPGLNHLALHVDTREHVDELAAEALKHGWRPMFADRYPFAGGEKHYAAYLENADGFEIELVAEPQGDLPVGH